MKTCSSCEVEKPLEEYYLRSTGKPEARCKPCFIAAQAEGIRRRQQRNIERGDSLRRTGDYKICSSCGEAKLYEKFNRANKNPDGHSHNCNYCSRPYAKKYYEQNKERINDSQSGSRKDSILAKREYLAKYYKENPCVDCGNDNILVLQSDHQHDKKHEIARLVNSGYALQTLIDELEKCVTRCANCHQIVTAKNFGFWRLEYV